MHVPSVARFIPAYRLSDHARLRMRQRAIDEWDLRVALSLGTRDRSGPDLRYTLTDRALVGSPYQRLASRLRGLCVVLTLDGVIRTVKWRFDIRHRAGVLRGALVRALQNPPTRTGL